MIIILISLILLSGSYLSSLATLSLLGVAILICFFTPASVSRAIVMPVNLRKDKTQPNL